jgi:hypothetical protein
VFWEDDLAKWDIATSQPQRFPEWINLEPMTGKPVLLAFIPGSYARELEHRSDDDVVADAMDVLGVAYG